MTAIGQLKKTNSEEINVAHKHYRVYGQRLCSNFALPQIRGANFDEADIAFRFVTPDGTVQFSADEVIAESRHETNVDSDLVVLTFKDRFLMRFEGKCDFLIKADGRYVECHALPTIGPDWVRSIFYGMVMAFCLHLMKQPNLHASAFATPEGAFAFMAAPGSGKSTLAATFGARGFPLLTDDILAIDESPDGYSVHSGFPFISLSPESVDGVFGVNGNRPDGYMNGDKMRLSVDGKWATPETGKVAVKHLLVLSRAGGNTDISIERISGIEATRIVVENTLCLEFLPKVDLSRHLAFASRIALSVPVWRLSYPTGFERIKEVQDAVLSLND